MMNNSKLDVIRRLTRPEILCGATELVVKAKNMPNGSKLPRTQMDDLCIAMKRCLSLHWKINNSNKAAVFNLIVVILPEEKI